MTIDIPCCNTDDNGPVLQNAAWEKLKEEFGVDQINEFADLQLFFVPQGAVGGAYAYVPGSISVYGDIW